MGKVVAVVDGDSIVVMRGRNPIEVRLHGIDCPEHRQPWGKQAKRFTQRLMGQHVRVQAMDVDRHGRLVARVFDSASRDNGLELIQAGLAWWYGRYAPKAKNYEAALAKVCGIRASGYRADRCQ